MQPTATPSTPAPACGAEPMLNAHQAADALGLPVYWFADPKQRAKYRIPHYRLVTRVRFRLSELTAWSARSASTTAPRREVTP
ncbi:hypothetical protein EWI61_04770 [Methylolobus aquaticus]|nr:hypothetical protein EWI61_04770 [Methylolobus aquaticus]